MSSIAWTSLEILQVDQRIEAQQNIGSENPIRVQQMFYAPHHARVSFSPHSRWTKESHIDSRSVLRLQRAVKLYPPPSRREFAHETVVLLSARVFAQLCDHHHEMQVSICSVPRGREG